MALIAAAAAAMMLQQSISIARSQQLINYDQALKLSDKVTNWSISQLELNLKSGRQPIDVIPMLYPSTKLPNGSYRGILLDAQAKFNLNNLSNANNRPAFTNMLKVLFPRLKNPQSLTDAISNWVSPQGTFNLSLDDAYHQTGYPSLPPHQFMHNTSELRQVAGVSSKIYQALLPYVTALPTNQATINVNTAPAPVLLTLSDKLSLSPAQQIIKNRPYQTTAAFYAIPSAQNFGITTGATVESQYFLSRALVKLDEQTLLLNSILFRSSKDNLVHVLWQTQG